MSVRSLRDALDEANRATAVLYSNGHSEAIRVPKPLRPLLAWKPREDLIVIVENEHTLRVVSLSRHMVDMLEADRRERAGDREAVG